MTAKKETDRLDPYLPVSSLYSFGAVCLVPLLAEDLSGILLQYI